VVEPKVLGPAAAHVTHVVHAFLSLVVPKQTIMSRSSLIR
jgi:hypothetical protein